MGEIFLCFFGAGEGLASSVSTGLSLGEASGVGLTVALGEAFAFGLGDGVGVGDGFFFFAGLGDGDVFFFLVDVVVLRCLCGVGVGVGSKIFLILSPNDSSAARFSVGATQSNASKIDNRAMDRMNRFRRRRFPAGLLCSAGCRHQNSRAENFRSANARDNWEAPTRTTRSRRRGFCGNRRRSECCRPRG